MVTKRDDLFKLALELDATQRAELAALLMESLEADAETGVEAAWRTEVEQRMRELDTGVAESVPWSEARKRLYTGLNG